MVTSHMTGETVRVNLDERSYDIVVTSGDSAELGPFARQRCRGTLAFVVTDDHVTAHADAASRALSSAGFRATKVVLQPGEQQKTLGSASILYNSLSVL